MKKAKIRLNELQSVTEYEKKDLEKHASEFQLLPYFVELCNKKVINHPAFSTFELSTIIDLFLDYLPD